jgi:hypothetical protein
MTLLWIIMGYSGTVPSLSDDETLGTWINCHWKARALHGSSPESLPYPSQRPNTIRSLQDLAAEPALVQISVARRMLEGKSAGLFHGFSMVFVGFRAHKNCQSEGVAVNSPYHSISSNSRNVCGPRPAGLEQSQLAGYWKTHRPWNDVFLDFLEALTRNHNTPIPSFSDQSTKNHSQD